jgi:hypothetical protein
MGVGTGSGLLSFTTINAIISQQMDQIGIMKAVEARLAGLSYS